MRRPQMLDMFCGAGGAAMGYHLAGWDLYGIDTDPAQLAQYPFPHERMDAAEVTAEWIWGRFDAVHASPPCQRFSSATRASGKAGTHPDLIEQTRELLVRAGVPFVIENVPTAPIRRDIVLCGSMFGLNVRRHRAFEIGGWHAPTPALRCRHHEQQTVDVTGNAGGRNQTPRKGFPPKYHDAAHARELMQMPWATGRGCVEAVPPAYTQWIGAQMADQIESVFR